MKSSSLFMSAKASFGLLSGIGLFVLALPLAAAEVNDDFSISDVRPHGTLLNEKSTPGGESKWMASPNLLFVKSPEGGVVTNANASIFFARTAVPEVRQTLEVSAELRPTMAANKDGWVALGFGANPDDFKFTWTDGVFILLTPAGGYQVMANYQGAFPETIDVRKGTVAPFSTEKFTKIKLVYEKGSNRLSVLINGTVVVDRYDFSNRDFYPVLSAAGFSGFGQKDRTFSIRNFEIGAK